MICTDRDKIAAILEDPAVWMTGGDDAVLQDGGGKQVAAYIEALANAMAPNLYVLMPMDGMLLVGERNNLIAYWSHVYIAHWARRNGTIAAGKSAMAWMWDHTPARKIMGLTPVCFDAAILWASAVGLRKEGTSKKSFLYKGKIWDRVLFGVECERM